MVEAKNIVIATGSEIAPLQGHRHRREAHPVVDRRAVARQGAASLLVVGAGVIGLELGSVWRRLGAKVTVVEFLDRILPGMDGEVAKQFQRILEKQGFAFKLGPRSPASTRGQDAVGQGRARRGRHRRNESRPTSCWSAIGRVPYTEGLGLKEAGVELDDRGRVQIDGHFATSVKGIYAIGDVIVGPMLAHKAEDEGIASPKFSPARRVT